MAREWFGNGAPTSVSGRLEFVQDEGDMSHTLVELDGLGGQVRLLVSIFPSFLLSFYLTIQLSFFVIRCEYQNKDIY